MNGIGHSIEYLEAGMGGFPEGALRLTLISMLGLVLIWSGSAKVRVPRQTAVALVNFRVVRKPSLYIAWTLIAGELLLGVTLLIGLILPVAMAVPVIVVAATTFGVFSIAIGRSLAEGQDFACACFGSDETSLTRTTLYRSSALGLIAAACAVAGPLKPASSIADFVLLICAASSILGAIVLLARSRELIELSRTALRGLR